MVVKARLEFSPTRCEAIRFVKIIHSMGDQQLGRHKVPLLASVQRHLEKDGSPIFFGLTVRHGRLRDTTRRPYKANARKCVPADSTALCAWLACFVAGAEGQFSQEDSCRRALDVIVLHG